MVRLQNIALSRIPDYYIVRLFLIMLLLQTQFACLQRQYLEYNKEKYL